MYTGTDINGMNGCGLDKYCRLYNLLNFSCSLNFTMLITIIMLYHYSYKYFNCEKQLMSTLCHNLQQ